MKEYLKFNIVARQIFENEASKTSDNKKTIENFIGAICDSCFDIFKIVCFDLGSSVERNPDSLRAKLSDVSESSSVKELTSKLDDYCKEAELSSVKFTDTKKLYLDALQHFCDALNRIDEISDKKGYVVLSCMKKNASSLQRNVDSLAGEKKKKYEEMSKILNESIFVGFGDRIENLKKILYNLITSAEGKNQKSGYGKDWKRIFIELDQKLNVLQATKAGISEKDRNSLDHLESKIEKYSDEFYNSYSTCLNRHMSDVGDSEDLTKYYQDVVDICSSGLDLLARAKTQYMETIRIIKEKVAEDEVEMIKYVFPLKKGDDDSNKRFGGTDIISKLQSALSKSIPSASGLLNNGSERGVYGDKTESVIKAIQKNIGNKNVDGKIDKSLLDSILMSDFLGKKDRDGILDALRSMKKALNEADGNFIYTDLILENKIFLDKETFNKDLDSFLKKEGKKGNEVDLTKNEKDSYNTDDLCRKLRKNYGLKIESEDLKRADGGFKSSYSGPFVAAWDEAVNSVGEDLSYTYFYWNGGVYSIDSVKTNLKNSRNIEAWALSRQLKDVSDDDASEFVKGYLEDWTTFGMIKMDYRLAALKSLYRKNEEVDLDFPGVYNMAESLVADANIPYISYSFLTSKLGKAIEEISQVGESDPDLEASDIILLNNLLCMCANAITYNGEKFVSCIDWIYDNSFVPSTATRIAGDSIVANGENKDGYGYVLSFGGNTMKVRSYRDLEGASNIDMQKDVDPDLNGWTPVCKLAKSSSSPIKNEFGKNLYFISAKIYPSIKVHVNRMNANSFSDVPQEKTSRCYNSKV